MSEDEEIFILKVVRTNLSCTVVSNSWKHLIKDTKKDLLTCRVYDQKIDGEGFSIIGDPNQIIQGIYIPQNQIKFLPENIVESFPALIGYLINNCSIKTVKGKHFKGLNKLETLFLERNEIETIDGDSFKDLTKLDFLNLAHNKIEFLDEKIFDNLRNIRQIELNNNKISIIPVNLFKNNLKLVEITLNDNKIQTISSTLFDHLNNLEYIDLESNVCVNDSYGLRVFNEMKTVLRTNCRSSV